MALARVTGLTFAYPDAVEPALRDVDLELREGEVVALLGVSGSGKSTLLRALAGLVPHFHGGRFAGRVDVCGRDTRLTRPADLAGSVASVFQDPEDQIVMARAANEVAFGLENVATPAPEIWPRVAEALDAVGAAHLAERRLAAVSGGELQRVCLASALALRPRLLLLDEPTSQLDPAAADAFLASVVASGAAAVVAEHRTRRLLDLADRVLFVEGGRLVLDAPPPEARRWLAEHHPEYVEEAAVERPAGRRDAVLAIDDAWFTYADVPAVAGVSLAVGRGEVVALEGANGSGKTTLAKLATGLLEPQAGTVVRGGRGAYLSQDPGRYLTSETVLDEVALGVGGDLERARAALRTVGLEWAAARHPRDLSSGERERAAFAAVAVTEPDLLVLDEPTRGVDPARKLEIARWLHAYARRGRGVLVATHDRGFPADRRVRLGAEVLVAA